MGPILQSVETRRSLGIAPQGLADRGGEFHGKGGLEHDHRLLALMLAGDLEPVGGVRIDDHRTVGGDGADGGDPVGVGAGARHEAVAIPQGREFRGVGKVEVTGSGQLVGEESSDPLAVAAEQVVNEPFEVGRLGDVHRRAGCLMGLCRGPDPVDTRGEELVQHGVLVGGQHEPVDRDAHLAGHVPGADVAEVARGHRERDRLVVGIGDPQPGRDVVDHLGEQAGEVDRVDGADAVLPLEGRVGVDLFDQVLTVVEDSGHRDVDDVWVADAEHLGLLEG